MAPSVRTKRLLGKAMRMPAALDRRGLRWALHLTSPAEVVVLVHRGRQSGRVFTTPLEVMATFPENDEIILAPVWGKQTDWYRNVVGGGLVEVRRSGEPVAMDYRKLEAPERRRAFELYRTDHPIYSRAIIRMVRWGSGLNGDNDEVLVENLPALALRPTAAS